MVPLETEHDIPEARAYIRQLENKFDKHQKQVELWADDPTDSIKNLHNNDDIIEEGTDKLLRELEQRMKKEVTDMEARLESKINNRKMVRDALVDGYQKFISMKPDLLTKDNLEVEMQKIKNDLDPTTAEIKTNHDQLVLQMATITQRINKLDHDKLATPFSSISFFLN